MSPLALARGVHVHTCVLITSQFYGSVERFVKRRTRWSHTVNGSSHTVEGTSLLAVDMSDDGLRETRWWERPMPVSTASSW